MYIPAYEKEKKEKNWYVFYFQEERWVNTGGGGAVCCEYLTSRDTFPLTPHSFSYIGIDNNTRWRWTLFYSVGACTVLYALVFRLIFNVHKIKWILASQPYFNRQKDIFSVSTVCT